MFSRLLWSQWHESILPRASQEDACEALLSHVVHRFADPAATVFEQRFAKYLLLTPASTEKRDMLSCGIRAGAVPQMERNVRALIHAVRQDVVPFARCRGQKGKVPICCVWPQDLSFPFALSLRIERPHFVDLALKCLQTLLSISEVVDCLTAALDAHVPMRPLAQQHNHATIVTYMLDKKN